VQQLLEIMPGRSASEAIAALRKSHGNIHTAASTMASDEAKHQQRSKDRRFQHQCGICQNGRDLVNVSHIETLKPLLAGCESNDEANLELAVGLLRLTNNDLQRSLELYAEQGHDPSKVLILVDGLDERLLQQGLMGEDLLRRKKKTRKLYDESKPVDEVALVSLISMGVGPAKAKAALQQNGNDVERAIIWYSTSITNECEAGKINDSATARHDDSNQVQGNASTWDNAQDINTQNDLRAGRGSSTAQMRNSEREAQELLHKELENILEERDLEKEYLGSTLDEEWQLVQKYRQSK